MTNSNPLLWTMTYTGRIYWPHTPRERDVDILDIAHGLSQICRYGGQSRDFYSVAEHSVLMSYMVPPEHALEALLHDGHEAYVGDVTVPLKHELPQFSLLERKNELAVRHRFGFGFELHQLVKKADRDIVITEYETLFGPVPTSLMWTWDGKKDPTVELKCWCPTVAEKKFLERYDQLKKEKP